MFMQSRLIRGQTSRNNLAENVVVRYPPTVAKDGVVVQDNQSQLGAASATPSSQQQKQDGAANGSPSSAETTDPASILSCCAQVKPLSRIRRVVVWVKRRLKKHNVRIFAPSVHQKAWAPRPHHVSYSSTMWIDLLMVGILYRLDEFFLEGGYREPSSFWVPFCILLTLYDAWEVRPWLQAEFRVPGISFVQTIMSLCSWLILALMGSAIPLSADSEVGDYVPPNSTQNPAENQVFVEWKQYDQSVFSYLKLAHGTLRVLCYVEVYYFSQSARARVAARPRLIAYACGTLILVLPPILISQGVKIKWTAFCFLGSFLVQKLVWYLIFFLDLGNMRSASRDPQNLVRVNMPFIITRLRDWNQLQLGASILGLMTNVNLAEVSQADLQATYIITVTGFSFVAFLNMLTYATEPAIFSDHAMIVGGAASMRWFDLFLLLSMAFLGIAVGLRYVFRHPQVRDESQPPLLFLLAASSAAANIFLILQEANHRRRSKAVGTRRRIWSLKLFLALSCLIAPLTIMLVPYDDASQYFVTLNLMLSTMGVLIVNAVNGGFRREVARREPIKLRGHLLAAVIARKWLRAYRERKAMEMATARSSRRRRYLKRNVDAAAQASGKRSDNTTVQETAMSDGTIPSDEDQYELFTDEEDKEDEDEDARITAWMTKSAQRRQGLSNTAFGSRPLAMDAGGVEAQMRHSPESHPHGRLDQSFPPDDGRDGDPERLRANTPPINPEPNKGDKLIMPEDSSYSSDTTRDLGSARTRASPGEDAIVDSGHATANDDRQIDSDLASSWNNKFANSLAGSISAEPFENRVAQDNGPSSSARGGETRPSESQRSRANLGPSDSRRQRVLTAIKDLNSSVRRRVLGGQSSTQQQPRGIDANEEAVSNVPVTIRVLRKVLNDHFYERPHLVTEQDIFAEYSLSWSDLFFDIVYVGVVLRLGDFFLAGLNLGPPGGASETPVAASVFLFASLFYAVFGLWWTKMHFASKCGVSDVFHKLVDLAQAMLVVICALNITSPQEVADYSANSNAFVISGTIGLFHASMVCLWTEVLFSRPKDVATKACSLRNLRRQFLALFALFLAMLTIGLDGPFELVSLFWGLSWLLPYLERLVTLRLTKPSERAPFLLRYVLHRLGDGYLILLGEGVMQIIRSVNQAYEIRVFVVFALGFLNLTAMRVALFQMDCFDTHAKMHVVLRSRVGHIFVSLIRALASPAVVSVGIALKVIVSLTDNSIRQLSASSPPGSNSSSCHTDKDVQIFQVLCIGNTLSLASFVCVYHIHRTSFYRKFRWKQFAGGICISASFLCFPWIKCISYTIIILATLLVWGLAILTHAVWDDLFSPADDLPVGRKHEPRIGSRAEDPNEKERSEATSSLIHERRMLLRSLKERSGGNQSANASYIFKSSRNLLRVPRSRSSSASPSFPEMGLKRDTPSSSFLGIPSLSARNRDFGVVNQRRDSASSAAARMLGPQQDNASQDPSSIHQVQLT